MTNVEFLAEVKAGRELEDLGRPVPSVQVHYPALRAAQAMTRKDKLEIIADEGCNLDNREAAIAWRHLIAQIRDMSLPESHTNPKFNDLLLSIMCAVARVTSERSKPRPPRKRPRFPTYTGPITFTPAEVYALFNPKQK